MQNSLTPPPFPTGLKSDLSADKLSSHASALNEAVAPPLLSKAAPSPPMIGMPPPAQHATDVRITPQSPPPLPIIEPVPRPNISGSEPSHLVKTTSSRSKITVRNSVIGGLLAFAFLVASGGAYFYNAQAKAHAEQLALEKRQAEKKMQIAANLEAEMKAAAEKERLRLENELALAKEQQAKMRVEPMPEYDYAKMLLSDTVPKFEADRRELLLQKASNEDRLAEGRLNAMQAQKLLTAFGAEPASALSAVEKLSEAALNPTSSGAIESVILSLESLPKPARGYRKAARIANDVGLSEMKAEHFDNAVVAFNRTLTSDPADVEVLGNLAYAYLLNGQLAEASRIAKYSIRIAPRRAGAWNQLAVAHAQRGMDWMAVRDFVVLYNLSGDQVKSRAFLTKTAEESKDIFTKDAAKRALLVLPNSILQIANSRQQYCES